VDSDDEQRQPVSPISSSDSEELSTPEVFVYPCFMKPGRHKFFVYDKQNEYYLHRMLAPIRIENIPSNIKEIKSSIHERRFEKHNSVFRDFVEDTPESI